MTIQWDDLVVGGLSGCIIETGRVFISYSIVAGVAGPASAMVQTAAIYQTLFGVLLASQSLDFLQVAGIFLGFIGVCVISFLNNIVKKA